MRSFKLLALLMVFFAVLSCSKEEKTQEEDVVVGECAGLSNVKDTVLHNGVSYIIISNSAANNLVGVEIINIGGGFTSDYEVNFLQVIKGSDCYQNNNSTEGTVVGGKFFSFQNMPSWATDTNTVSVIQLTLDKTTYNLRDLQMNQ